ncbi:hypothetical protein DSECCO2_574540 [anaerobic digester metagenome]
MLSLQLVGEGFERAIASATHRACLAAIIDQGIHRFLQHPFLVAQDHLGSSDFQQAFEAVIASDYPAVKIVEVCSGKSAAFQRNQRTQRGRKHRQGFHNHISRGISALDKSVHYLQLVDQLLFAQGRFFKFEAGSQVESFILQIDAQEQFFDGFSAHQHDEVIPHLVLDLVILVHFQQFHLFIGTVSGIDHDEGFII